jgi:hypothetical protein
MLSCCVVVALVFFLFFGSGEQAFWLALGDGRGRRGSGSILAKPILLAMMRGLPSLSPSSPPTASPRRRFFFALFFALRGATDDGTE